MRDDPEEEARCLLEARGDAAIFIAGERANAAAEANDAEAFRFWAAVAKHLGEAKGR